MKNSLQLLLIPPVINPVTESESTYFTPVGMQALLGSLAQSEIRAEIYRPHILITGDDQIKKIALDILSNKSFAIGFSTWCDSFPYALLISEEIRKADPGIPIIFGGPQASVLAEQILEKYSFIDFVLQGEADRTLPRLITFLLNGSGGDPGSIPGITFRDDSGIIINNSSPDVILDMDGLPVPAYETISHKGMVRIDAGRGCPYNCTYCSTNQFFSKKYRVKSAKRLIREFKYCEDRMGVTWIGISHDMFTLKKKVVEEFARELIRVNKKRKNPFSWTCSSRTDCVTESMLDLMYESGCRAIFFGMETGSPKMQKAINKNLDIEKASHIISHSASLGIFTVVSYMMGFPGETAEDLNLTMQSIIRVAANGANTQLTMLSLLPGTPVYRDHVNDLRYDGYYSPFSSIYPTKRIKEMIEDNKKIFSSFYHLPNKEISRDSYLFISELANYIEQFIPSLSLVRDSLISDLRNFDPLKYITSHIPDYQRSENMVLPELFFLTDSIKGYLEGLMERYIPNQALPIHAWDVFQFDLTRAFMIAKFNRWQMINAGAYAESNAGSPNKSVRLALNPGDRIEKRPYWSIIQTQHYLYNFVLSPIKNRDRASFRKGIYHYLILPFSHRLANVYKIPRSEVAVYDFVDKTTVGEIIRKNEGYLPEDRILHIIRRMNRLGLIDIFS